MNIPVIALCRRGKFHVSIMDTPENAQVQSGTLLEVPVAGFCNRDFPPAKRERDALPCYDLSDTGEWSGQARRRGEGDLVIITRRDRAR